MCVAQCYRCVTTNLVARSVLFRGVRSCAVPFSPGAAPYPQLWLYRKVSRLRQNRTCVHNPSLHGSNPEGCQTVAGGRSEAETSGRQAMEFASRRDARTLDDSDAANGPIETTLRRRPAPLCHPSGVRSLVRLRLDPHTAVRSRSRTCPVEDRRCVGSEALFFDEPSAAA